MKKIELAIRELNKRRFLLIGKEMITELTDKEKEDLEKLNTEVDALVDQIAPLPTTYHSSPTNSTQFTTCCNIAIMRDQSCCPGCGSLLEPRKLT